MWGVEKGRGGSDDDALLAELLDGRLDDLDGLLKVGLPDVTSVNNTDGENGLWAKGLGNSLELLWVADEIDVDSVDVCWESIQVVDDVTEVGGKDKLWDGIAKSSKLLVGWLESSLNLGWEIKNKRWLVDLDGLSTGGLELLEEIDVNWEELLNQGDWVDSLITVWLSESEERDWANKDWSGDDAGLLGLVELSNGLWLSNKLELLVVLEGWLDVVVVRVEPLNHLEGWNIDTILLVATAHSKVLVNLVQVVLGVSLRDSLCDILAAVTLDAYVGKYAYREILDVCKDLIVKSKVVGWDDINTGILLDLPVSKAKTLGLGEEILLGDLASPVVLSGLLKVTVGTHAWETEDGAVKTS